MAKGIKGFDYEKCFEAAKHSAMLDHLGLDAYKRQGFISIDDEHESVSKTVEYAYDDWCIAQMAQMLNKTEDYHYSNEARLVNWALFGEFKKLERDRLSSQELDLLAHLEERNAVLLGRGLPYEQRKPMLKQYAMDWRMARTPLITDE